MLALDDAMSRRASSAALDNQLIDEELSQQSGIPVVISSGS